MLIKVWTGNEQYCIYCNIAYFAYKFIFILIFFVKLKNSMLVFFQHSEQFYVSMCFLLITDNVQFCVPHYNFYHTLFFVRNTNKLLDYQISSFLFDTDKNINVNTDVQLIQHITTFSKIQFQFNTILYLPFNVFKISKNN